jgi:manganese transport protein
VTPVRGSIHEAALEGATADGASVGLREGVAGASPLDELLAKGRLRATLAMLGPAFVASIAYVDPGNFATNLQGGARYGYLLLWVVLLANLIAMLIQYLSAKLGIVTGQNLPQHIRARWARPLTWGMWVQAEVMAMATDIAEFLGAALGLNLLFGVPLLPAGSRLRCSSSRAAASGALSWRSPRCSGSSSSGCCTRR